MSELRSQLEKELQRQQYSWGHISPDRWRPVEQYAGSTVLDVGCSNGVYVKRLRDEGRKAWGVDLLDAPQWRELPGAFGLSDARKLPFAAASFDTVISFETLEHVPGPEEALRDYHRVCQQNIIISVPNCEMIPSLVDAGMNYNHWIDRTHVNFFTMPKLCEMVESCGFSIRYASPILPLLTGLPFFSSLGLPYKASDILARAARKLSRRRYHMSLLIVADKQ
jgi:ubiquinone/menaquinone biosynthesis C-methylase UbiE